MIVMKFCNGHFLWVLTISNTFWNPGKFPMMRRFCGDMNIFELTDLFICKATLDTHEVISVSLQAVYLLTMLYHKICGTLKI